nr:hypothetical protein [Candidatus Melainabacteria bacterium]
LLLASIVAFTLGWNLSGTIFSTLSLLAFFAYMQPDFQKKTGIVRGLQLMYIRYLVNLSFFVAQLISGLRIGTLYIAPVISERV